MYEITWEDVKTAAIGLGEELDEFTPPQEKFVLNMAHRRVPESRFNEDTFEARAFYAAHKATIMFGPAAGEGTVSGESIGSVSTSATLAVNNPKAEKNILSTAYGREYYELMLSNFQPMFFG